MANLIIKSSADNLVLQGSDASPAITVGATGTLTFAENVTMSGTANNLGTVTAGSIAGGTITSATTFPNGHIVQISTIAHTYTQTGFTSQTEADWSGMSITITPTDATNKIIVCGNLNLYSVASHNANIILKRNDGGGFDTLGALSDYLLNGSEGNVSIPLKWVDTPAVTVQCTYKIQVRSDAGGQCYYNLNDGSSAITHVESSNSWMYAMEVVA